MVDPVSSNRSRPHVTERLAAELQGQLGPFLRPDRPIGLSLGLYHREQQHYVNFGRSIGGRPPTAATIYEIGSLTKPFTALLLARMVDQGRVSLDQPAADFLPEAPDFPRSVTLAALASHTAGLPRLPPNIIGSLRKNRRDPYANYFESDLLEWAAKYRPKEPSENTGKMLYSNLGMGLLGFVLGRALGMGYGQAIEEMIARPLGLTDTRVALHEDQQARLAPAHGGSGKPTSEFHIPTLAGAGALRSTTHDIVRFLATYLTQEPAELRRAMASTLEIRATEAADPSRLERLVAGLARLINRQKRPEPEMAGIGLGWIRMIPAPGQPAVWFHNGATGGYRSFAAFRPETGTALVLLLNRGLSEWDILRGRPSLDDLGFAALANVEQAFTAGGPGA